MIQPVRDFVTAFLEGKSFDKVLEVGSRNVNGSIKEQFTGREEYIGLDLIEGTGVDVVDDVQSIPKHWVDGTFDLVICVETLEHVKDPIRAVEKMRDVLKSDGWLLITTPGIGHPEHGWPSDYYRFWEATYRDVFFEGFLETHFETKNWEQGREKFPDAILGYGRKP